MGNIYGISLVTEGRGDLPTRLLIASNETGCMTLKGMGRRGKRKGEEFHVCGRRRRQYFLDELVMCRRMLTMKMIMTDFAA